MRKQYDKAVIERAAIQLAAAKRILQTIRCDSEFCKEFGKTSMSSLESACDKIDKVRNCLEEKTGELVFFGEAAKDAQDSAVAFLDEL